MLFYMEKKDCSGLLSLYQEMFHTLIYRWRLPFPFAVWYRTSCNAPSSSHYFLLTGFSGAHLTSLALCTPLLNAELFPYIVENLQRHPILGTHPCNAYIPHGFSPWCLSNTVNRKYQWLKVPKSNSNLSGVKWPLNTKVHLSVGAVQST